MLVMREIEERPILFSVDMVRAILEGRKSQTRRVSSSLEAINENPSKWLYCGLNCDGNALFHPWDKVEPFIIKDTIIIKCPYGHVGDRLWVREGIFEQDGWTWYKADDIPVWVGKQAKRWPYKNKNLSARYMPRWASRITLEITGIRVERLQEITHKDALAEGVYYDVSKPGGAPVARFQRLWDSINSKNHPWESNPWVWVIEFTD